MLLWIAAVNGGIDPQFDSLVSNVTVIRGDTATLPCAIDSLGKFKVNNRRLQFEPLVTAS